MPNYLAIEEEKITLPVNCRKWNHELNTGFERHYHTALEMIVVINGEMKCTVDTRSYILKSGGIVLSNPYSIHSGYTIVPDTVYLCLTFEFSEILNYNDSVLKSCAELLENGHYMFDEYYSADEDDSKILLQHTMRLYQNLNTQNPGSETIVLCELYSILSVLFDRHYHENPGKSSQKRNKQFIQNFSVYLQNNYNKQITTADAAKALFLSTSRFSYLIKQHFGCSFTSYLRQYRIECAIKNYTTSSYTIKEISEAVGFTDYCYFSHAFKEHTGISPSVYFNKRRNNMEST